MDRSLDASLGVLFVIVLCTLAVVEKIRGVCLILWCSKLRVTRYLSLAASVPGCV